VSATAVLKKAHRECSIIIEYLVRMSPEIRYQLIFAGFTEGPEAGLGPDNFPINQDNESPIKKVVCGFGF
jgi:hypothetical protein